jgi:hypothetical protein
MTLIWLKWCHRREWGLVSLKRLGKEPWHERVRINLFDKNIHFVARIEARATDAGDAAGSTAPPWD